MSFLGAGRDWRKRNYLMEPDASSDPILNLRLWLEGQLFVDSSPDNRSCFAAGNASANNAPAPTTYRFFKTSPFDPGDLGTVRIRDEEPGGPPPNPIVFGDGDFLFQFYLRNTSSNADVIMFQRGESNGGFGCDLTLFENPDDGHWTLCMRVPTADPATTQMLGFGAVNDPAFRVTCGWLLTDIPVATSTERFYQFRRRGAAIEASVDNGPWILPSNVYGATALPSASFYVGGPAGTPANYLALINRFFQAYTYDVNMREYKIWTESS